MTVQIECETDIRLFDGFEKVIRRVVRAVLDEEECPYEAQVNVVITDNEAIREVNREYRQIDAATDVLSFPMLEYDAPGDLDWLTEEEDYNPDCFDPDTGELLLGDIIISAEKVSSQAEEYGHSR